MTLSFSLLQQQNADTSNAIITEFSSNCDFLALAKKEGDLIQQRDAEDGEKLQKGIDCAKSKGVIDPNFEPEKYVTIDVLGKTPTEVCDSILDHVKKGGAAAGIVILLCGLSGTGKGTTVTKLREKLEADGKKVVCWSNGNIFRSVTLLAATWCEQNGENDIKKALTPENLASFMSMLSFDKQGSSGNFDTRIHGLGLDYLVSEVQNTILKETKVAKNIPTVAEVTQGEVITFAADAIRKMSAEGIDILLEGREQTVNYVRTPFRFTLTLSDETLIGKRRAAQRLMAAALTMAAESSSDEDVKAAILEALAKMI